tara:strand:+ start:110 stop:304 length:195 start_codon:yes stop_codon:yes gene_type:complete
VLNLAEIELGSALLSIFILIGYIATAFVFVRLTIIGINYVRVNYLKVEVEGKEENKQESETKGF